MAEQVLGRVLMNFAGEYDLTKNYNYLDVVTYQGSSYVCQIDNAGNLPTDNSYWRLLAKAGKDGKDGQSTVSESQLVVNATKFDLVGDGSTDNTQAMQKMADWVGQQTLQPTIFFPQGTYLWSSTVQFNEPVTLTGLDGTWLKYTGSGTGLLLGKDGMDASNYLGHCIFTVEHLGFTGGENSQYLIQFNNFVTQSRVSYCRFHDAGGRNHGHITDFCIHFNADAWDGRVEHCQFDVSRSGGQRQFVDMEEYGNSRVVVADNLVTSLSGYGTAVFLNGCNNQVIRNKIEGFQNNVRLGTQASQSIVAFNYFEKNGSSMPSAAVEIGNPDAKTSASPRYIYIAHNYAGLHNKAGKMYSTLVGPSSDKALLRNVTIDGNFVNAADYTTKPTALGFIVRENNLAGQVGNHSVNNYLSQGYQGILDMSTSNGENNLREPWIENDSSSASNSIDTENLDKNNKPSEIPDGFSYALKKAEAIGIDRSDFAKDAQAGSKGLLTTKAVSGLVKQHFELLDGLEPLNFERTGSGDTWTDWFCMTNWN